MRSFIDKALDRSIFFGYTSIGYRAREGAFEPLPSMAGKTVVITGGTGGLGAAAAHQIAALGAHVVVVARNEDKAERLVGEMQAMGLSAEFELADLALMAEVRSLAERLRSRPRLDVLINNAGVLFGERELTSEGLERSFALNLLSQYILTKELHPLLVASSPARVILVSSGGMYSARIRPDDLEFEEGEYTGTAAYARTKRGQVILAEVWAEEWKPDGITVHSMHPGWADTPGVDEALPTFSRIVGPLLRTPEQGADTITFLAASEDAGSRTGLFWHDREPRPTHIRSATRESPEDRAAFMAALDHYAAKS